MEPKDLDKLIIGNLLKHLAIVQNSYEKLVVLLLPSISAIQRGRLIERKVDFIVPGKQLFLPSLLLDLKEEHSRSAFHRQRDVLLPSAQFLLIYHLVFSTARYSLAEYSLKLVADMTGYTPMAITKAAKDLERFDLIDIIGTKEKSISFKLEKKELWDQTEKMNLLRSPVLKRVFIDEIPDGLNLYYSYFSAIGEYSDLNPGNQDYIAVDKKIYHELEKRQSFVNPNSDEGRYCIEVWSYNPVRLTTSAKYVDPLSLYLSLKDTGDERIEMACEQIIDRYQW
ncbi:MAG: hypothetical protein KAR19_12560 [Bacteroidales bacterium]|nr:hypothetical protein [Bacteroidales bacterium]